MFYLTVKCLVIIYFKDRMTERSPTVRTTGERQREKRGETMRGSKKGRDLLFAGSLIKVQQVGYNQVS